MEAILVDARRSMRSILRTLHAIFGAGGASKRAARGSEGAGGARVIGSDRVLVDIYGRRGKADLYSDRESFGYFRAMSSRRDEIF